MVYARSTIAYPLNVGAEAVAFGGARENVAGGIGGYVTGASKEPSGARET